MAGLMQHNLRVHHTTTDRLAGRAAGWMLVAGGSLTLLLLVTMDFGLAGGAGRTGPLALASRGGPLVFGSAGVSMVLGAALAVAGPRVPRWFLYLLPAAMCVLITLPSLYAGETTPTGQVLLIWPVLYAGYLLPEAVAYTTAVLAMALFGFATLRSWGAASVAVFVEVEATLLLSCVLTVAVRRRVNRLLTALRTQAKTDSLTGLANRRALISRLDTAIEAYERDRSPLALCFLDIDHFKQINDLHGHAAGDDTLQRLAELLRGRMRPGNLVARTGGEEFAAVLCATTLAEATRRAERLRSVIERTSRTWPVPLTVSIGVAALPDSGDLDADGLLSAADGAMYAAKTSGRNAVRVAAERVPGVALAAGS
ncbi:GGDEF domain-containing protein [Nocardia stercoris]|uniref:GGDEF domain-containing protein n=1 Tax=Nocardia stercoris TaxID=2483361 RepID=A0A3M2L5P6_9NOCA|nr:GGDEF domain-containing protein [Nocardia stercoris]RMI29878.1 GGDEF domain-containing protein [Nocardia stercoris]